MHPPANPVTLADWRRQTAEMYASIRCNSDYEAAWRSFCRKRSHLFKTHPQSPLTDAQKKHFTALAYYPYNPAWRLTGTINTNIEREIFHIQLPADGEFTYTRVAKIHFSIWGNDYFLSLFWINGYGGGLFLPFKDSSAKQNTYGGGRYLYDTIKGADLNDRSDQFILDFNYAYNPSCAYNSQWVCPLPPPENALPISIEAGEQRLILDE